jgi:CotH kinase protein/Secretion system C-terminal sorting domain
MLSFWSFVHSKKRLCVLFIILFFINNANAQLKIFDESKVNRVDIIFANDSTMDSLYATLNAKYYSATFVYSDDSLHSDTMYHVGIRIRGNTSLASQKKSYKIAFDKYDDTTEYKKLRKLNLIGNHNDPTMVRERLFYHCYNKLGFAPRRVSHVNLYINNKYFGIYSNLEEIDKQWLKRVYNNDTGNLYKCIWGADLNYIDDNPSSYSSIGGSSPVYDLQTNSGGNYKDLVQLIKTINAPNSATYLANLDTIFNYKNFLKIYALDVATGNWDDYAYNKNNYLLWHDSITNKFEFITFDTDNTFGVDWFGIDWTKRDPYKWYHPSEARPLIKTLLSNLSARNMFTAYLDTVIKSVVNLDSLNKYIDTLQNQLAPFVPLDSFRKLDYGYDYSDFVIGYAGTVDSHTPYGIKPFLQKRKLFIFPVSVNEINKLNINIYPNPTQDFVVIENIEHQKLQVFITNNLGQIVFKDSNFKSNKIDFSNLKTGNYNLIISDEIGKILNYKIIKN